MNLPPLIEKIDRGAAGGHEFERLMHQLMYRYADKERFSYEPLSSPSGDDGIDGLVRTNLPGHEGMVAFQYKWLWGDIHKGDKSAQIKNSLERTAANKDLRHWILVTPLDLKPSERQWLKELPTHPRLTTHSWGQQRIESLLRLSPALFARYYPEEAKTYLDKFEGFDFREFSQQYRQKVSLVFQNLRTLGLPPETLRERDTRAEIRLRDIFVPLRVLPEQNNAQPQEISELLRAGSSPILLGDPGTGKSTLLSFIALLHTGGANIENYTAPQSMIPLFISLRDFTRVRQKLPNLSIIDYITGRARSDLNLPQAHWAFFESALRMGEAIILCDGLDEVGNESARQRISGTILSLRVEYSDCPCWVTCRIYGYTRDVRLPSEHFFHARLTRLDDQQINRFIDRWYELQCPHNDRERLERAASLRGAVHRTPSVRRLSGNPLLLTLMAFIHQGLRRLPQDRGELYEKCVEMLLKTWQEAKREEGSTSGHPFERLSLHIHTQKDYLAHLALHIQQLNQEAGGEEARGLVSRRDALECLAQRHLQRSRRTRPELALGSARDEMGEFLDYISDQTGLLIDRGGGQLSFLHLSFQEYLAAWVFTCGTSGTDTDFFEMHLGEPAWEEVLLLRFYIILRTQGGGGEEVFDRIIRNLLTILESTNSAQGYMTLVRALRDNLDFAAADQRAILQKALEFWLETPNFSNQWFFVIEDVSIFGERAKASLREILINFISSMSSAKAIACVHIATKLFKFPIDAVPQIASRPDISLIRSDLAVFCRKSELGPALAESMDFNSWLAALHALDSHHLYRLSLKWATSNANSPESPPSVVLESVLTLLWIKITEELLSRREFAKRHGNSDVSFLFNRGVLVGKSLSHILQTPLCGVQTSSLCKTLNTRPRSSAVERAKLLNDDLALTYLSEMAREDRDFGQILSAGIRESLERSAYPLPHVLERDQVLARVADILSLHFLDTLTQNYQDFFGSRFINEFYQGNSFGRDFDRYFLESFVSEFVRYFAKSLSEMMQFDPRYARELNSLSLGFHGIHDYASFEAFSQEIMLTEDPSKLNLGNIFTSLKGGLLPDQLTATRMSNIHLGYGKLLPEAAAGGLLFYPLYLLDYWIGGGVNHLFSCCRSFAHLHGIVEERKIKQWLQSNPFEVIAVALSWEARARAYSANHGKLHGLEGAILLAHAAYTALMTGYSLESNTWCNLLDDSDRENTPIRIGHFLLSLCTPQVEMLEPLNDIVTSAPTEYLDMLRSAGFM